MRSRAKVWISEEEMRWILKGHARLAVPGEIGIERIWETRDPPGFEIGLQGPRLPLVEDNVEAPRLDVVREREGLALALRVEVPDE